MRALVCVLVTLTLAAPTTSEACEMADRYRLIPLSTSGGKVIALEMREFRDSSSSTGPAHWSVFPAVVELRLSGQQFVHSRELSKLPNVAATQNYDRAAKTLYAKAIEFTQTTKGHKLISTHQEYSCQYLQTCAGFRLVNAKAAFWLARAKPGKQVLLPPSRYKSKQSIKEALFSGEGWGLDRVRVFSSRIGELTLVSLGTGGYMTPCAGAAGKCAGKVRQITPSVTRTSPALHHGHHFDVLLLAPKKIARVRESF